MATVTPKYFLKKPLTTEKYDVTVFNENSDKIDVELDKRVEKIAGKGLSTEDFTTLEKEKLALAVVPFTLPEADRLALVDNAAAAWEPEFATKYAELETTYAPELNSVKSQLAEKVSKDEVTNVMTPKGSIAYASLPTTGNTVGWYYYCSDGDGTHGKGNYVWNGTAWYFGGTGDDGYNMLKIEKVDKNGESQVVPKNCSFFTIIESNNKLDFAKSSLNMLVNVANGALVTDASNDTSDYLKVPSTNLYCTPSLEVYATGTLNIIYSRIAQYRADKTFIKSSYSGTAAILLDAECVYVRVSYSNSYKNSLASGGYAVYFTADGIKLPYVPYSYEEKVTDKYLKVNVGANESIFNGKKMTTVGDSITTHGTWQPTVVDRLGLSSFQNCGVSGSCIVGTSGTTEFWADSRINAIDADADFIVIMGGTNDVARNVGTVSLDNIQTYELTGAMNALISKLLYRNRLSEGKYSEIVYTGVTRLSVAKIVPIFFVTPIQASTRDVKLIAQGIRDVCALWGLPVIDANKYSGLSPVTMALPIYSADGIHLNATSGKVAANCIASGLEQYGAYFF